MGFRVDKVSPEKLFLGHFCPPLEVINLPMLHTHLSPLLSCATGQASQHYFTTSDLNRAFTFQPALDFSHLFIYLIKDANN